MMRGCQQRPQCFPTLRHVALFNAITFIARGATQVVWSMILAQQTVQFKGNGGTRDKAHKVENITTLMNCCLFLRLPPLHGFHISLMSRYPVSLSQLGVLAVLYRNFSENLLNWMLGRARIQYIKRFWQDPWPKTPSRLQEKLRLSNGPASPRARAEAQPADDVHPDADRLHLRRLVAALPPLRHPHRRLLPLSGEKQREGGQGQEDDLIIWPKRELPDMRSAKISKFLTPFHPCPHLNLIYSIKFTQPPLLHLLFHDHPPPLMRTSYLEAPQGPALRLILRKWFVVVPWLA